MIQRLICFLVLSVMILGFQGCYTTRTIAINDDTVTFIKKPITVVTKDGRNLKLIAFAVTDCAIIGKDTQGHELRVELSDVKEVRWRQANQGVAFILSAPIAGVVILILLLAASGFSGWGDLNHDTQARISRCGLPGCMWSFC